MGKNSDLKKNDTRQSTILHFRRAAELAAFVKGKGRIVYPMTIHYYLGYYTLTFCIEEREANAITVDINRNRDKCKEINDPLLKRMVNGDIRRQFLTDTGEPQFLYLDFKVNKLYLIDQSEDLI